jgi:hypothetical protein
MCSQSLNFLTYPSKIHGVDGEASEKKINGPNFARLKDIKVFENFQSLRRMSFDIIAITSETKIKSFHAVQS